MKRILATTVAALVAVTALAGAADAKPKWNKNWNWKGDHHPHYNYHPQHPNYGYYYRPYSYDPGPAIVAGTIFGMIGALAANGGYRTSYGGPHSHVAWCEWRYKTYNPATDTYFARPGVPAVCHSPY